MITPEQAAALRPGDKLVFTGLTGRWSKFNGREIVCDDPPIHFLLHYEFVHFIKQSDIDVVYAAFDYVSLCDVEDASRSCTCDLWKGCTCGAIQPYRAEINFIT